VGDEIFGIIVWGLLKKDAPRQCLIEHLSTIHAKSIEHNDIEPRNIVVRKDKIKVIDFGLAEAGHECHGTDMCAPLQSVKGTLLG